MKPTCSVNRLFGELSKMWTLQILYQVIIGNNSFNNIKKALGTISPKTLTERLKELQLNGFIERKIISETPIKIQYQLTEKGECFSNEIGKLNNWAEKWGY